MFDFLRIPLLFSWGRQHEIVEKLNMQAIVNASGEQNEFVKEFLINESKFPLIIYDLIATEMWREKIFSELIAMKYDPDITFPIYMVVCRPYNTRVGM